MGTEFVRITRDIVKTQTDQNQEENAATELKRGKCCEGVSTTMTGVPDLRQTAEYRKESSIRGGGSNREHKVATGLSRQTREEKGNTRKTKENNAVPEPNTGASVVWYGKPILDERSRSLA